MKKLIMATLIALAIGGCSKNCDDEIEEAIDKNGFPEEINTYSSGDANLLDYWWWSKGLNMTFRWESGSFGYDVCDVDTFTFDPIRTREFADSDDKCILCENKE